MRYSSFRFRAARLLDYVGGDIFLDSSGKRFVDESAEVRFVSEAFLNLPDRVMWVVTDAQSTKNSGLEAKLLTGVVDTAGSIQELADKMGVDRAVLKYTIDRYNKFAEQGRDEDFGKTAFTQKIEKPPFYFGKERFDAHFSCGGLKINPSAQVLDQADRPIKNLYAAGEVTGGIHGRGSLRRRLANLLLCVWPNRRTQNRRRTQSAITSMHLGAYARRYIMAKSRKRQNIHQQGFTFKTQLLDGDKKCRKLSLLPL